MFKPKILSYAANMLEQDVTKTVEEKNGNKLIGTALRHYAELVSLADGLLRQAGLWRSARDGEDIVQDVLLKIIRSFHDGEGQEMRGGEHVYLYYIKAALRNSVKSLAVKIIEKRQKPSDLSDNVSSGLFEAESILCIRKNIHVFLGYIAKTLEKKDLF